MAQLKEKTDYNNIFEADTFGITIKCLHCGSDDCFIGLKYISYNKEMSIDVVCHSCGHIEGIY